MQGSPFYHDLECNYMGRRKITTDYYKLKQKALKALVKNNYNFTVVSKEYGVSRSTLKAWLREYEKSTNLSAETALIKQETALTIEGMKMKVAKENYEAINNLTKILLKKAEELVQTETDLTRICLTMRAVADLHKVLLIGDKSEVQPQQSPYQLVSLFQQSIYQLNSISK